jgi:hypothetical protein
MQTVPNPTLSSKPSKSYRATLRDEPGVLTKMDGDIQFFHDSGEIVSIEPLDCVWLCVLGEVGIGETQALLDRMHGGPAYIATHRAA